MLHTLDRLAAEKPANRRATVNIRRQTAATIERKIDGAPYRQPRTYRVNM